MNEGVDSGAHVLKINDEGIYLFKHGLGRHSGHAIETKNRNLETGVDHILGRDHIILLFSKESVLGTEQRLQLARETMFNQSMGRLKASVNSGGVCQEPEAFSLKHPWGVSDKCLNAGLHRFHVWAPNGLPAYDDTPGLARTIPEKSFCGWLNCGSNRSVQNEGPWKNLF